MISQGVGRGELFKPLILWGKGQMSKGNPSSCQPPFLSFMPSHLKLVKEVISLGWERYGGQIRIWGVTHFWENVFLASWKSKCWKNAFPSHYSPMRYFLMQLEIDGAFSLTFFYCFLHFSHG